MSEVAADPPKGTQLTPGERRILRAIWDNGDGVRAAAALGLSWWTIRTTTQNVRSKLGVQSTLEAIRVARIYVE